MQGRCDQGSSRRALVAGRRARGSAFRLMLVCVVLLAGGCQGVDDLTARVSGLAGGRSDPAPAPALPDAVPSTVVACLDVSGSVPEPVRRAMFDRIADEVAGLGRPGFEGARVVLRLVTDRDLSHRPEATLLTVDLPAVPEPLDPPDREANPLAYQEALAAHLSDSALRDQEIEEARQRMAEAADRVRALAPPVAQSTDIGGCVLRASEILANAEGPRRFVLISDLVETGRTEVGATTPLPGVRVRVVMHCILSAVECQQQRSEWQELLLGVMDADDLTWLGTDENIPFLGLVEGGRS